MGALVWWLFKGHRLPQLLTTGGGRAVLTMVQGAKGQRGRKHKTKGIRWFSFSSPPTPHRRKKELCALLFLPWSILHWTFLCAFHFTFDFMGLCIVNHLIKWDFGVPSVGQFSFCISPLWDFGAHSFDQKVEKQST
jgi:hypothetical protein